MFSYSDEIKSQNKIIRHKMLQINSKKYIEMQRHSNFLQSEHPDLICSPLCFSLQAHGLECKAMNLAFW